MPKSWSKVHVESSGKYRIRIQDGDQEHELSVEFESEEEAESAIEEFKQAPTNRDVVKPKSW